LASPLLYEFYYKWLSNKQFVLGLIDTHNNEKNNNGTSSMNMRSTSGKNRVIEKASIPYKKTIMAVISTIVIATASLFLYGLA